MQDTRGTAVHSREQRDIYLRLGTSSVVLRSSAPPNFSSKPVGNLSFPKACWALPYHLPQRTQARSVVVTCPLRVLAHGLLLTHTVPGNALGRGSAVQTHHVEEIVPPPFVPSIQAAATASRCAVRRADPETGVLAAQQHRTGAAPAERQNGCSRRAAGEGTPRRCGGGRGRKAGSSPRPRRRSSSITFSSAAGVAGVHR